LGGTADLNVVIRTAVVSEGTLSIGVGGALVALSDREAGHDEMVLKGRALVDALGGVVGRAHSSREEQQRRAAPQYQSAPPLSGATNEHRHDKPGGPKQRQSQVE